MIAAQAGDVDSVVQLMFDSSRINTKDENGKSAFVYACINKHHEIIQMLMTCGADINCKFRTDKKQAWGSWSQVYDEQTPLKYACLNGDDGLAFLLLSNGADQHGAFGHACKGGNIDLVIFFLKHSDSSLSWHEWYTGLMKGCANVDVVKLLVQTRLETDCRHPGDASGARTHNPGPPDKRRGTSWYKNGGCMCEDNFLKRITRDNRIDVLVAVLQLEGLAMLEYRVNNGMTLLIWAVKTHNTPVMAQLLAWNAEVNKIDYECKTALMHACERGHVDAVQMLVVHHANIHIQDAYGRTAFTNACIEGHINCAEILLCLMGPEAVDALDCNGRTALVGVCRNHNLSSAVAINTIDFLLKHTRLTSVDYINMRDWTIMEYSAVRWAIHRPESFYEQKQDNSSFYAVARYLIDRGARLENSDTVNSMAMQKLDTMNEFDNALEYASFKWFRVKNLLMCLYECGLFSIYGSKTRIPVMSREGLAVLGNKDLVRVICDFV
jgi:ankyrin repeat protein